MLDEITYSFPNFNGTAVEVWEWISNFTQHFTGYVITYPYWEFSGSMLVKVALGVWANPGEFVALVKFGKNFLGNSVFFFSSPYSRVYLLTKIPKDQGFEYKLLVFFINVSNLGIIRASIG